MIFLFFYMQVCFLVSFCIVMDLAHFASHPLCKWSLIKWWNDSLCNLSALSNDSFEGEPEEKRRKTTNVVIDQPATEHKVLIDNVPDNSSLLEEVRLERWINSSLTSRILKIGHIC